MIDEDEDDRRFAQRAEDWEYRDYPAPDECTACWQDGKTVKFDNEGNCPNASNPDHSRF